ncbi:MAG: membrane lipoprotein lipid attachment site-containing protein [Alphaproteobacteria bacterium]|nr:membrane lipoprotein lipid attachment site-containing protein [Alphaproteobacteria bacterium]MCL2889962.1 membrane lipoprotein lipid attachment site-containing protein [Alphaproteobacteria bacterium]
MKKVIFALLTVFALAGCGQVYDREPVGIGFDNDELKLSPCACIRVFQG